MAVYGGGINGGWAFVIYDDDIGVMAGGYGSIKPKSITTDMPRLYANMNAYDMVIVVENTGTVDCATATFQLELGAGLVGESVPASLVPGTIEPGKKKEIPTKVRCSQIQNEYEYKKIGVTITDPHSNRVWQDAVSLKFHRGPVNFNIKANRAVSGVIIAPTAQTYSFSDVTSDTLTMPWSTKDYLVVFSGATAETEAKYSLGIDAAPDSDFDAFSNTANYETNNTEDTATPVSALVMTSYLHKNDIDYYRRLIFGGLIPRPLGRLPLGVRGICSPAYTKISRRNLQYPAALPQGFFNKRKLKESIDGIFKSVKTGNITAQPFFKMSPGFFNWAEVR